MKTYPLRDFTEYLAHKGFEEVDRCQICVVWSNGDVDLDIDIITDIEIALLLQKANFQFTVFLFFINSKS